MNYQLPKNTQQRLDKCVEKEKQSEFINQAVLVALKDNSHLSIVACQTKAKGEYFVYSDGGARGNPGIAGCGVVIFDENKKQITELKHFMSHATNNEAEYTALLLGVEEVVKYNPQKVIFYLDSELIVKQMKGEYKIKKAELKEIYLNIQESLQKIAQVSFVHIPREKNKLADKLANEAMDEAR